MAENKARDPEIMPLDSPTVLEAIARADFDVQIATAQRWPKHSDARGIERFVNQAIALSTQSREVAEGCLYAVPRAGTMIQGPSIRMAEIVLACYGNMKAACRLLEEGDKNVTVQAVCHDLENNVSVAIETRRRITTKDGRRYNDDMITTTVNAAAAIALRNAIFKIVPAALCAPIFKAVKTEATGGKATLEMRIPKALNRFALMGVTGERVLGALGKTATADVTEDDLALLIGLYNAIKSGEAKIDEAFPPLEGEGGNRAQKLASRLAAVPPASATKEPVALKDCSTIELRALVRQRKIATGAEVNSMRKADLIALLEKGVPAPPLPPEPKQASAPPLKRAEAKPEPDRKPDPDADALDNLLRDDGILSLVRQAQVDSYDIDQMWKDCNQDPEAFREALQDAAGAE